MLKLERTPLRLRPKAMLMEVEGKALLVVLRNRHISVREGDALTLYIADTAPLYEWRGIPPAAFLSGRCASDTGKGDVTGMIYHIFNYRIQGEWYRDSATYSEAQFERIMEALDWKLPVHMQIYHYGSPDRKYYDLTNAIVVKRPVLSLDPMALAVSPQEKRTSVYDKQREISWPVVHRLGRFLICQPDDDWPRFCYADGDRFSLITPMDITPVSIKEAMEFVRQNHRPLFRPTRA